MTIVTPNYYEVIPGGSCKLTRICSTTLLHRSRDNTGFSDSSNLGFPCPNESAVLHDFDNNLDEKYESSKVDPDTPPADVHNRAALSSPTILQPNSILEASLEVAESENPSKLSSIVEENNNAQYDTWTIFQLIV